MHDVEYEKESLDIENKIMSALSDKDCTLIDEYICAYGDNYESSETGESEYICSLDSRMPIRERLRYWCAAKKDLFKLLGNQLIYEREVTYEVPIEDINFDKLHYSNLTKIMRRYVAYTDDNPFYELDEKRVVPTHGYYLNSFYNFVISVEYAYSNIYSGDTFYLVDSRINKRIKIEHGCKYSKIMGKLASFMNIDSDIYEEWRLEHSFLLNTKITTGKLCFSIHPMDYITMSDGTFHTCMSWTSGDGCYRAGTIEMMNSPSVLVVYLKSNDDRLDFYSHNKEYSWNMKKWRILAVADKNFVHTIKPYPYDFEFLEKKTASILKELAETNWGIEFYDHIFECGQVFDPDGTVCPEDGNARIIYSDEPGWTVPILELTSKGNMYCDIGSSNHYAYLAKDFYAKYDVHQRPIPNRKIFNYCGPMECMLCGAIDVNVINTGTVFCDECFNADNRFCCVCCDRRVSEDDVVYDQDGEPYCQDCARDQLVYCSRCATYTPREDSVPVLLDYKGIIFDHRQKTDNEKQQMLDMVDSLQNNTTDPIKCLCKSCANRVIMHDFTNSDDGYSTWFGKSIHWEPNTHKVFEFIMESVYPTYKTNYKFVKSETENIHLGSPIFIILDIGKMYKTLPPADDFKHQYILTASALSPLEIYSGAEAMEQLRITNDFLKSQLTDYLNEHESDIINDLRANLIFYSLKNLLYNILTK